MKTRLLIASGLFLAAFATVPPPAHALTSKECSAKYKAAKAGGTLNGMKWNDFRKAECGGAEAPAAAPPAAAEKPAPKPAPAAAAEKPMPAPTAAGEKKPVVARTAGDAQSHARLQRRLEDHEGGRQASGWNEVAAILAPVRPAEKSGRHVTARPRA